MFTLQRLCVLLALVVGLFVSTLPAHAQMYDGFDNDGDGQIDEPDEYDGGSPGMGQTEALCVATARLDYCLTAHNMYCRQFGLPGPCALAQIGNNCNGGDPRQCQYYQELIRANTACAGGDPNACAWLGRQPVAQTWMR